MLQNYCDRTILILLDLFTSECLPEGSSLSDILQGILTTKGVNNVYYRVYLPKKSRKKNPSTKKSMVIFMIFHSNYKYMNKLLKNKFMKDLINNNKKLRNKEEMNFGAPYL